MKTVELSIEQQIKTDVFDAAEKLLKKANEILANELPFTKDEIKRYEELEKLGFKNAEVVRKYRKAIAKRDEQKKIIPAVEYFSNKYPSHKFISEKQVKKLCKKYNLLLADVGDYKAEIPEKNQREILGFKVDEKDAHGFSAFNVSLEDMLAGAINGRRITWGLNGIEYVIDTKSEAPVEQTPSKPNYIPAKNLKIVAPAKKLNKKNRVKDGHKLLVDDPIVLQPVHHNGMEGYLIVTSWGLEANDESMVNPNHN